MNSTSAGSGVDLRGAKVAAGWLGWHRFEECGSRRLGQSIISRVVPCMHTGLTGAETTAAGCFRQWPRSSLCITGRDDRPLCSWSWLMCLARGVTCYRLTGHRDRNEWQSKQQTARPICIRWEHSDLVCISVHDLATCQFSEEKLVKIYPIET